MPAADPFAALYPLGIERLPIAWTHLRVPGPPPAHALNARERAATDPATRFARRTVQTLIRGEDRLGLIDKVAPHSLFDLMVCEVSDPVKATSAEVTLATGQLLWQTGLSFVRHVRDPEIGARYGLSGGATRLALNCDPHTQDRESVQAAKHFHLHLLHWTAEDLAALASPGCLGDVRDARLRRQALDPVTFLGARLIVEALAALPLAVPGARWLPSRDAPILDGTRPLGALLEVPDWASLDTPEFARMLRDLHLALAALGQRLLELLTGESRPPLPWRRHRLLPRARIRAGLAATGWSAPVRAGLEALAGALRDLGPATLERLRHASAARRQRHITLNPPAYALTLGQAPGAGGEGPLWLTLQPKLFSGIGGAGLLALGGVPSVRVLRGVGTFSEARWRMRADFQRGFAAAHQARVAPLRPDVRFGPLRRLADGDQGWVPD